MVSLCAKTHCNTGDNKKRVAFKVHFIQRHTMPASLKRLKALTSLFVLGLKRDAYFITYGCHAVAGWHITTHFFSWIVKMLNCHYLSILSSLWLMIFLTNYGFSSFFSISSMTKCKKYSSTFHDVCMHVEKVGKVVLL